MPGKCVTSSTSTSFLSYSFFYLFYHETRELNSVIKKSHVFLPKPPSMNTICWGHLKDWSPSHEHDWIWHHICEIITMANSPQHSPSNWSTRSNHSIRLIWISVWLTVAGQDYHSQSSVSKKESIAFSNVDWFQFLVGHFCLIEQRKLSPTKPRFSILEFKNRDRHVMYHYRMCSIFLGTNTLSYT